MSHTAAHANGTIKNPGTYVISSKVRFALMLLTLIGTGIFSAGLVNDTRRTWAGFILNHFYFMSLALGGLFFAALQWATNAMWSAPIRRLSESFTAYLPVVLLTFGLIAFAGIPYLYIWNDQDLVKNDLVLLGKSGYLAAQFFTIRNLVAVALWIFFAYKIVGNSLAQDKDGSFSYTLKNRKLAPAFIVVFGITFTMASFDQLMSLDPHWFSTMFGVYCFAGLFYANLASTCLLTLFLRSQGKLNGIINDNHLHDLGKLMFAFTVFWAYIGFSQFMLIWYANLPEETGYFIHRLHGDWFYVSLFLFLGKFLVPFFCLLARDSKRNPRVLAFVGIFMLIAQWIDVLWMVQPEFYADGPVVGLTELGLAAGFLGIFGLAVAQFLGRNNIVAIGDPRLNESVFHHHQ